jgi:hypothetical protein
MLMESFGYQNTKIQENYIINLYHDMCVQQVIQKNDFL